MGSLLGATRYTSWCSSGLWISIHASSASTLWRQYHFSPPWNSTNRWQNTLRGWKTVGVLNVPAQASYNRTSSGIMRSPSPAHPCSLQSLLFLWSLSVLPKAAASATAASSLSYPTHPNCCQTLPSPSLIYPMNLAPSFLFSLLLVSLGPMLLFLWTVALASYWFPLFHSYFSNLSTNCQ